VKRSGYIIQDFEFGGVLKYEWGSGSAEPGRRAPPRMAQPYAGGGCGRGSPPPAEGVRGYNPRKNLGILHAKS
jgi:hypothetical protein